MSPVRIAENARVIKTLEQLEQAKKRVADLEAQVADLPTVIDWQFENESLIGCSFDCQSCQIAAGSNAYFDFC